MLPAETGPQNGIQPAIMPTEQPRQEKGNTCCGINIVVQAAKERHITIPKKHPSRVLLRVIPLMLQISGAKFLGEVSCQSGLPRCRNKFTDSAR